jgi:pilus assembly protein Flp/PilA
MVEIFIRRYIEMREQLNEMLEHQEGQGLAEYALILALIAIIAIVAVTFLGTQIASILSSIGRQI